MASPPRIEIDALLAPLAGDTPAGNPVSFVARKRMDDARKEVNPESFAADDPRRPEAPIVADWPGIERMTVETLSSTSKDLLVAARLTEALTKQYGFGGTRDGLQLLRRLIDEAWDRINPVIEEGDLEPRAAAFNWLGEASRGALFPNTIRHVPLVSSPEGSCGWQYWRDLQDGKGNATKEVLDKGIMAATRDHCQEVVDDIAGALKELEGIGTTLDGKMGENGPSLAEIRSALEDCQTLATEILNRKGPAPLPIGESDDEDKEEEEDAGEENGKARRSSRGSDRPSNREEIYARLAELSTLLIQLEPHSPVAYIIQRAVKLGQMPLPQLMKVLIRNQEVLNELNRDLDLGFEPSE